MDAHTLLPAAASSAAQARRFVRQMLEGRVGEDLLEVVELLTSEVVTNAVLHARSPAELVLRLLGGYVRVEVTDDSEEVPRPQLAGTAATSGRGLVIVESLADSWGVESVDGNGKRVWFQVPA